MTDAAGSLRTADQPRGAVACGLLAALLLAVPPAAAQITLSGRFLAPRYAGASDTLPLSAVVCFASLNGPATEARSFRTWETDPAGWWRITGSPGNYTILFTGPAHFVRPLVLNNVFTRAGDKVERFHLSPRADFACFHEGEWDPRRATDYFQTFVARGRSVTHVGFRLAHDGVDGFGPGAQNLLVSIHRRGDGTPDHWPQVGPTASVLNVDSGGGKNYVWSAGWDSGEVPLVPGETYAVHLRAETPGNTFQAFWRADADLRADCFRLGAGTNGFQHHDLWLSVGTDGDGLLVPFNKKVHQQFGAFAGFASKWSQTYVAQGRGLAAAVLYAAVGGAQPPLSRQRVAVRARRGGPAGPVVGLEKIAIGNGNYTGDASWGMFGVAFAPGEVPLAPGETYALEFASIENYETLHGFVNIKGQVSDERPGFNPYRKIAPDTCARGAAFKFGRDAMDFDLDLQVIEYEFAADDPARATDGPNLLANGGMEAGAAATPSPAAWKQFSTDPGTTHVWLAEGKEQTNRLARVLGGGATGKTADGGFVQRVEGLSRRETYRVTGQVRASWPLDPEHQCFVGCDPTGQDTDPQAATIQWTTLPGLHGVWVNFASDPIRPATNALSVWLRGRTTLTKDYPFRADFDDFALRRVRTEPPPAR
jgi:hypothetical protein